MRLLLAFPLLLALPALALTPDEAGYIAERDKAIAALEQKWSNQAHDRAIAALTPRLKRIVGPPPKGTSGDASMTPDSLCCGVGSAKLDGMVYGEVLVTTVGLLRYWLRSKFKPPIELEAGIDDGADIYATGIVGNAAVEIYATLPIVKPPGVARVAAHLALASQGGAQSPPKDLGVIVWKGDRVFIAFRTVVQVPELPACEAVLAQGQAKVRSASDAGKSDDAAQFQVEAEDAYVRCWSEHVRGASAYPAILQQAQRLADTLAAD
jgi:hypothetical protein